MKYKLLRDLPFLKEGNIFSTGCWANGGFGVDRGSDSHGVHNGVTVFAEHENLILSDIIDKTSWVEKIPESNVDKLDLYDSGYASRIQMLGWLK